MAAPFEATSSYPGHHPMYVVYSLFARYYHAWTLLKGAQDFNRQPLAPSGIEMHMLDNSNRQNKVMGCKK